MVQPSNSLLFDAVDTDVPLHELPVCPDTVCLWFMDKAPPHGFTVLGKARFGDVLWYMYMTHPIAGHLSASGVGISIMHRCLIDAHSMLSG